MSSPSEEEITSQIRVADEPVASDLTSKTKPSRVRSTGVKKPAKVVKQDVDNDENDLVEEEVNKDLQPVAEEQTPPVDDVLDNKKLSVDEAVPSIQIPATDAVPSEAEVAESMKKVPKQRKRKALTDEIIEKKKKPKVAKVAVEPVDSPVVAVSQASKVSKPVRVTQPRVRRPMGKTVSKSNTDEKRLIRNIEQNHAKKLMNDSQMKTLAEIAPSQTKEIIRRQSEAAALHNISSMLPLSRKRTSMLSIHGN